MISKEKLRDSNFVRLRQLSPTIGQFFALSIAERIPRQNEKDRQFNNTICCRMSLSHSLMRLCTAGVGRSVM
jgi:hypothetical protein